MTPLSGQKSLNRGKIVYTFQINPLGHAASESDGHRHISGTGGQLQFVRRAYASNDVKSLIFVLR